MTTTSFQTQTQKREYAVLWAPQGSQTDFLKCPHFECLYTGTRGCGKSDALLMDFAQHTGQGFGMAWRGILFRQSYKQLSDIITKSKRWFRQIFPLATYNGQDYRWTWPGGEELLFRYIDREEDYWEYHGHEYPWIGFEELTNWANSACYDSMKACCRTSTVGVPKKYRSTTNPWGPGFSWVKSYFIDVAQMGQTYYDPETGYPRVTIYGSVLENMKLLEADPKYLQILKTIRDPNKRKAWLLGSWDIVAGGALDDVWDASVHMIPPFPIPSQWRIDRSFDWGSTRPFSVGWWAEADGRTYVKACGQTVLFPRGTLFRIAEFYGWNGKPNEGCRMLAVHVAQKIKEFERQMQIQVFPGPADSSIFYGDWGGSTADDMARLGVVWRPADKGPGSRKLGLEKIRRRLEASLAFPLMEEPGLFIFNNCRHFQRTVPTLPRDPRDPDDCDSRSEDHIFDETRYRVLFNSGGTGMIDVKGV